MDKLFQISVLGLVQGLTEFLPISSSGHLAVLPRLFSWEDPGLMVDAFLHLGTLLALLIYFRKEILEIVFEKNELAKGIVLGTLPVVFIGFAIKNTLSDPENPATILIRSVPFIAMILIIGSIILWISEVYGKRKRDYSDLGVAAIVLIGLAQSLALLPGMSRSGICIAAALLLGLKRDHAAKFAFLLGLPAIAGAGVLSVKDLFFSGAELAYVTPDYTVLALGLLVSFLSGLAAIHFLIKFLEKNSTMFFIVYRVVLGIALLLFFA